MSSPALFVTTNGPGEVMGWVRPFLRAVYEQAPNTAVTVVLLPCAYATGSEAAALQTMFPSARVIDSKAYGRFLLGRSVHGMQKIAGTLQYLGGDLFHAVTIAKRLGLRAMTYKFTRRSYSRTFERFFAIDERNAQEMRAAGAPPDQVRIVGNLVADAVIGSLREPPPPPGVGSGICILPGSRQYELHFLMPFFLRIAREIARARPGIEITFVVSPFNSEEELRRSIQWQGDPRHYGLAGRYDAAESMIEVDGCRFAIDRSGDYHSIARSQLVISIPGTKCMEAAVLGRPLLVTMPLNRVDEIALNGVAAYLHRIPLVGRPLKRAVVHAFEKKFKFVAQPNIDAGRLVAPEMRGILTPEQVATRAVAMLDDPHALRVMGETLGSLYDHDIGAAERMAREALGVVTKAARAQAAG